MTSSIIGSGIGRKAVSLGEFDEFLDYLINRGGVGTDPQDLYASVAWTYWCVNLRADSIAQVPYVIYSADSDEDTPENAVKFEIDLTKVLWAIEAWLSLRGKAYVFKRQNRTGVRSLQVLNANTMDFDKQSVTADGPQIFIQRFGGEEKRYRADEILYFYTFSPYHDFGPGVSSGDVGQKSAELIAQANEWATKFFENGAIPAVFLTTEGPVPPTEQKEIESRWDRMLRGVKNAFKTKVLTHGITPTVIGQPVSDMAMPDLERTKREQILAAHKIPPGLAEAKTNRAERDALQFELWTQAIKPEVQVHIKPVVNQQLLNPMGLRIAWDWSQVETIQRAEIEKAESMSFIATQMMEAYKANVVSIKETRDVIDELLSWLALPKLDATFTPEERMPAQLFGAAQQDNEQPPGSEQSAEPPDSAPKKAVRPQWGDHRVSLQS